MDKHTLWMIIGCGLPEQIFEPESYFTTLNSRGIALQQSNLLLGEPEYHQNN